MKGPEKRHKVRRLFVLGAGASYSVSRGIRSEVLTTCPLDANFCQQIVQIQTTRPHWVANSRNKVVKAWKDYSPITTFGLEAAIQRQLGNLEFLKAIHARRSTGAVEPAVYLNHISHLIAYVLGKAKENKKEIYRQFALKVFPKSVAKDKQGDRIITFNYDTLLDQWLLRRFKSRRIYFDRIKKKPEGSGKRTELFDHPFLVKLHGSTNWRCSTSEFKKIIAHNPKGEDYNIKNIWHSTSPSPSADDNESPLIIPPLPDKPITTISLFRFLWTKAYEYLHEAEELVICGYSLPEADRLATSLFGNFSNTRLRKITIVDPNPTIISKWQQLCHRKNIPRCQWAYNADFGEYVESMDT